MRKITHLKTKIFLGFMGCMFFPLGLFLLGFYYCKWLDNRRVIDLKKRMPLEADLGNAEIPRIKL